LGSVGQPRRGSALRGLQRLQRRRQFDRIRQLEPSQPADDRGGPLEEDRSVAVRDGRNNQTFDDQGNFAGTFKLKSVITLDASGNTFTATNFSVLDPDGNEVFQGTGKATAKRVTVD
jgi:hypothetical protein